MKLEHRLSALHLHSWLNPWLHWIGQNQLHDETNIIQALRFGAFCILDVWREIDYFATRVCIFGYRSVYTEVSVNKLDHKELSDNTITWWHGNTFCIIDPL